MNPMYSEVSHVLDARPDQINTLLSEYQEGHRGLMPHQNFMELRLLGKDEISGNVVRIQMTMAGRERIFQEIIPNPVPVRVIMEYDPQADAVVAIVVEPTIDPEKTRVSIYTMSYENQNLVRFIEDVLVPPGMRHISNDELTELIEYMRSHPELPHAS